MAPFAGYTFKRFVASNTIQSNLGIRMILYSTKSIFDQKIQDFYVSDFEHEFGLRPNHKTRHYAASVGFFYETFDVTEL